MPLLLSFDLETTGLDKVQDRPIEVGAILYSTGQRKCLESAGYLVKSDVPIRPEITKLTGISQAAVDKFGYESRDALDMLLDLINLADAFVGQNVKRFDKPMLENWALREKVSIPNKLWIDTLTDLPGVEGKHLGYLAADHGFLNLFPHSALSDCQTVLKLVEFYDIDKIIERAQSPEAILISHQKYENNADAKARKFGWSPNYKIWYKVAKQLEVDEIIKEAPFNISFAPPEVLIEKLWY